MGTVINLKLVQEWMERHAGEDEQETSETLAKRAAWELGLYEDSRVRIIPRPVMDLARQVWDGAAEEG